MAASIPFDCPSFYGLFNRRLLGKGISQRLSLRDKIVNAIMNQSIRERHDMIRTAITRRPEAIADVTIEFWERLDRRLVPIIGADSFRPLFFRSVRHVSEIYPWISLACSSTQFDTPFAGLKASLKEHEVTDASDASISLLFTFIEMLAQLIGKSLTEAILRSAWPDMAPEQTLDRGQSA